MNDPSGAASAGPPARDPAPAGRRRRVPLARLALVALPLLLFAGLATLFGERIIDGGDPSVIPSALIGTPVPPHDLPALPGLVRAGDPVPGLRPDDLSGGVTLVNVFASWCAPCRVEHPTLMALSALPGLSIAGINYKDQPDKALKFLDDLGNPYDRVGVDQSGRVAIDWGVYGVPETYLVGPDGVIVDKFVGPLTDAALDGAFGERIRSTLAQAVPAS